MTPISMIRRLVIAGLLITTAFAAAQTKAQDIPPPSFQEALVKQALITFNDANITGDYGVMRLRAAKAFQDEFTADDLHEMFKGFGEQEIDIGTVAGMDLVEDVPTKIENGVMTLDGHFDTSPLVVDYSLDFTVEDNHWALIGINVSAKPAAQ